jgi:LuxR family maltose regulon positive regulatory protein
VLLDHVTNNRLLSKIRWRDTSIQGQTFDIPSAIVIMLTLKIYFVFGTTLKLSVAYDLGHALNSIPTTRNPSDPDQMKASLLSSKLFIPLPRPNSVLRPRLIEILNNGLTRKLALISAAPGFGKTTLVSEWVGQCELPVAWVSLDERDNDPVHFMTYLTGALQTIDMNLGTGALSTFQAPKPPSMESFLTGVINEIIALQQPFALVLDDYHVIQNEPVHAALTFLLRHMPPEMHLVIATREDPPLPLARLRGRGQLTELRSADLRFTTEEAAEFLTTAMGLELVEADISALEAKTEGWIAGLQLAAVSLKGSVDSHDFVQAFTGSNRYILDYLLDEVLHQQPEQLEDFMLRSSILDQMTGPLCDAVTGQTDSQSILEKMERNNLFLVPLDNERRWYRYHHLFAELLLRHLHQTDGDVVPELHKRAADWYENNGQANKAIEHALAAGNYAQAATLIEVEVEAILMRSEVATFLGWMDKVPGEVFHDHPRLLVYHAGMHLMGGESLEVVEGFLAQAAAADITDSITGELAVFHALIASYQGDKERCYALAKEALKILPQDALFLRTLVAAFLGLNSLYDGELIDAEQAFQQAAEMGQKTGNMLITVLALSHLAEICWVRGQLGHAQALYDKAINTLQSEDGQLQPAAGIALVGKAGILRERNEVTLALEHLERGIELASRCGEIWTMTGYAGLASTRQALGDTEDALSAARKAKEIAIQFDAMEFDDILMDVVQVNVWISQNKLDEAVEWADSRGFTDGTVLEELEDSHLISLWLAIELNAYVRLQLARGKPEEALRTIAPALRIYRTQGWQRFLIEALLHQAWAYHQQRLTEQALTCMEESLTLAEPEGYMRVFIDEGPAIQGLLQECLDAKRSIARPYVKKLLLAFKVVPKPADSEVPVEKLSERELEVLQLMAAGLSNSDIAGQLFISLNTVKTHLKNINSKLHVHSRTEALAAAKTLDLI